MTSSSGPASTRGNGRLGPLRKTVYALGDVTVNTALSSMSLVYASYFLVQVAGLRPALAGLVPLVGRAVDAITDPLMGEISDRTSWKSGRRRPYFLIGAIPFGLTYALLWVDLPADSQLALFVYYTAIYCLMSITMTVVSVPYLAIQPEMALDYDERTSINTYRTIGALFGTIFAVNIRAVSEVFGGGSEGFVWAGSLYGVFMALPWLAVYAATFERPSFQERTVHTSMRASLRAVFGHATFTRLTLIYIMGRIAMDLAGALIILYTTYWIGRSQDFELVMMLFLGTTCLALPFWLSFARGREKSRIFMFGSVWWMTFSGALVLIQPDWPSLVVYAFVALVGVGYAVVDLMPWSMVGEVIDEDELHHGERREGVYNGVFTFLRKLGGALGVFLALGILELAGYQKGEVQTETARQAIRWMTAFGPAFFLGIGVWLVRGYPLTREVHARITAELSRRNGERAAAEQGDARDAADA